MQKLARRIYSTVVEYTDKNGTVCYGRAKLFLKLNERGICICNALEKSSEQLSFNACDCDENVQSLLVSEQDRNSVRDVLEKYPANALLNILFTLSRALEGLS